MKVLQIVPGIGAESSGPSYSVPALCAGLQNVGCDVSLHITGNIPDREWPYQVHSYPVSRFPHPKLGRSPKMLEALRHACHSADIIHNNSLWMMPNVYADWARKGTSCKLVTQPRGTLSKWALSNSRIKKFIIGSLFQNKVLKNTDMWLATADSEADEIRALGFKQPICILPNGIDIPNVRQEKLQGKRRMVFLSRIHPKKNVEMLIRAWSKLEKEFVDWELAIVGPDKANTYADSMKRLAVDLQCQRVVFTGELNGAEKYSFLAESDCLVLPTHSENFGMVVAEALACSTPVICSYGAPWRGLNEHGCGYWIPTEETAFVNTMRKIMLTPREEIVRMGTQGRNWMTNDYSWEGIASKLKEAYEWLARDGSRPDCVRLD